MLEMLAYLQVAHLVYCQFEQVYLFEVHQFEAYQSSYLGGHHAGVVACLLVG
jgi:hypothetical protein